MALGRTIFPPPSDLAQMINKISAKRIGCFANFESPELRRFVVTFGTNGSGKSTLVAILRSLENGDSEAILERAAVGSTPSPLASIETVGTSFEFHDGWNEPVDFSLAVFDDEFVNRNIHSGSQLDNDHKKSLYSIVLGESCQDSLERLQEMEERSRAHNVSVRELEKEILGAIPADLSVAEFKNLQLIPDVERKITEQQASIRSIHERGKLVSVDRNQP